MSVTTRSRVKNNELADSGQSSAVPSTASAVTQQSAADKGVAVEKGMTPRAASQQARPEARATPAAEAAPAFRVRQAGDTAPAQRTARPRPIVVGQPASPSDRLSATADPAPLVAFDARSKPASMSSARSRASIDARKKAAILHAEEQRAKIQEERAKIQEELANSQLRLAEARLQSELAALEAEAEGSVTADFDIEDTVVDTRVEQWVNDSLPQEEPPARRSRPIPNNNQDPGTETGRKPVAPHYGQHGSPGQEVPYGEIASLAAGLRTFASSCRPRAFDLPVFDGNAKEWLAFKAAYDRTTEFNGVSKVENLIRLQQSLKGSAKELVSSFLFTESNPDVIVRALERHFGRTDLLLRTELDALKSLPRVVDTKDVITFAAKIDNTVRTIKALDRKLSSHDERAL